MRKELSPLFVTLTTNVFDDLLFSEVYSSISNTVNLFTSS